MSYRLALYLVLAMWGTSIIVAHARAIYSEDSFVRMIERQQGMFPGVMRTIPECGCTILYRGTRIEGRHYHVDIDKLD